MHINYASCGTYINRHKQEKYREPDLARMTTQVKENIPDQKYKNAQTKKEKIKNKKENTTLKVKVGKK